MSDQDRFSAMKRAARHGNITTLEYYIDYFKNNQYVLTKALTEAAMHGQMGSVLILANTRADIEEALSAAKEYGYDDIFDYLVRRSNNVHFIPSIWTT